jgi:hypothetical protein
MANRNRSHLSSQEFGLMNNRIINFLFVTSIWMFIALNGNKAVIHLIKAGSFSEAYPGGYRFKVFIAPFFSNIF